MPYQAACKAMARLIGLSKLLLVVGLVAYRVAGQMAGAHCTGNHVNSAHAHLISLDTVC